MDDVAIEERQRQANTNKHDQARLLHLRADSACAVNWTAVLRAKTRQELDARADPSTDPWNQLAEKFNNYEAYQYVNAVVQTVTRADGSLETLHSPGDLPLAIRGLEALLHYCWDIDESI